MSILPSVHSCSPQFFVCCRQHDNQTRILKHFGIIFMYRRLKLVCHVVFVVVVKTPFIASISRLLPHKSILLSSLLLFINQFDVRCLNLVFFFYKYIQFEHFLHNTHITFAFSINHQKLAYRYVNSNDNDSDLSMSVVIDNFSIQFSFFTFSNDINFYILSLHFKWLGSVSLIEFISALVPGK